MKKTRAEIDRKYLAEAPSQLIFGNAEQIKWLNAWREEIAEFEELERERNDPNNPLREWRVGYSYRIEDEDTVEAHTANEAKEIVREEHGGDDDFDIDYVKLVEAKKIEKKTEQENPLWQKQVRN